MLLTTMNVGKGRVVALTSVDKVKYAILGLNIDSILKTVPIYNNDHRT